MANWFDFNGVRSTTYGLYVQTFPPITTGEERAVFKPIPGHSGTLTLIEGPAVYDDIVLSVDCFVRSLTYLDTIAAWLRGGGTLVLGNDSTRSYVARCVNQLEMAKLVRTAQHRTLTPVFRCSPYRYAYPQAAAVEYTTSPGTINNTGTADAEPVITVEGSGDITLTIGAKTLQIAGLASAITIDVPAGLAYNGVTNLTASLTGDWPMTIPPGSSAVSWTGTVTKVTITRPWRYV